MKKIKISVLAVIALLLGISMFTVAEDSQLIDISQDNKYSVKIVGEDRYIYTGQEICPAVEVVYTEDVEGVPTEMKLTAETDYTVQYQNHIQLGEATILVTGIGNYKGSLHATFQITLGDTALQLKSYPNKMKVSWKAVPQADGYQIYRSTKKTSGFKLIKTITSGSTTSFVDKGLTCAKVYYYKLRSIRNDLGVTQYDAYTAVAKEQTRPLPTTIKEVSRVDYKSLKITWAKSEGANRYAIYRSRKQNGTYERVGIVESKTSFVDKNCSCARRYYYKVKAYRKTTTAKAYAEFSAPKSGYTRPSRVVVSSDTVYNSTKMTLKWKKVPYASGYEIYRSTKKGSGYKKIKTIASGKTISFTNKGLTKGKIYYYKVRAFREIDGRRVFGAMSEPFKKTKAGWRYVGGYKLYYNASGKLVKDVSHLIGPQDNYVIKVNKKMNTVTVYAKDGNKGYIIPVKAFVCSTGWATPTGTFYTPSKYRWQELMGPCWGQWCTRITGGILFHSVFYNSYNNNNALSVSAYNKLGITASHGCVRLTAGDAKWIYDNCDLGTKVIIYNGDSVGPLGKPTAPKLSSGHTWDPTDPNMKYKCKKNGCH